ncbi:MAG: FAD-dependent oxidoreductase [Deltaproteobacteria bacterium]|nr:FAD-dependent oxidoreductase [Deltaproteobacteria bacterium]
MQGTTTRSGEERTRGAGSGVHDRALLAEVAPSGWRNPAPEGRYDLVVIGGGPAGLVAALGAAGMGRRVALIEQHRLGGDCLNAGCVPSKALIASGRALAAARRAPRLGVRLEGEPRADFPAVMERTRRLRAGLAPADGAGRLQAAGVALHFGAAHFTGRDTLEVAGQRLRFGRALIATGARPALPALPGLEEVLATGVLPVLTSDTVFELEALPARLAVIGAGAIGCELSQAFARLGARVHLIEGGRGLLPEEEPELRERLREALAVDGVELHGGGDDAALEVDERGARLRLGAGGEGRVLEVDALLLATGRTPNVEALDLEAAGVARGPAGVRVDDHLRTTNPRIYAAGDVCTAVRTTHGADAMARIVLRNALFPYLPGKARLSRRVIPRTLYTDPELARVGPTAAELRARGIRFETLKVDLASVDRARLEEEEGALILHVSRGLRGGRILGASLLGAQAGEILPLLTLALTEGIPLHRLAGVLHAYPTRAEVIKRAADAHLRRRLLDLRDRILRPWTLLGIARPLSRLSPP